MEFDTQLPPQLFSVDIIAGELTGGIALQSGNSGDSTTKRWFCASGV